MQFDSTMCALPVYDGRMLLIPHDRMGVPAEGQLTGTPLEDLTELAGRVCYDSLGKGRSSVEFHEHVQRVNHLSVYEHATFTVAFRPHEDAPPDPLFFQRILPAFADRPGVFVRTHRKHGDKSLRVTVNFRVVLEWEKWLPYVECGMTLRKFVGWTLRFFGHQLAPRIVPEPAPFNQVWYEDLGLSARLVTGNEEEEQYVDDHERWITMFLAGSRGFSHELVRHGDFTAISQRSTRYVDESGSPWIEHPLITAYEADTGQGVGFIFDDAAGETVPVYAADVAREVYRDTVAKLQPWLEARGVDKLTARKQARGAARGFLGNALYTELIFSASVAQWKWMLHERASNPADAEIRAVFAQVLPHLKQSAHGECFEKYRLEPAEDGIGVIAVE